MPQAPQIVQRPRPVRAQRIGEEQDGRRLPIHGDQYRRRGRARIRIDLRLRKSDAAHPHQAWTADLDLASLHDARDALSGNLRHARGLHERRSARLRLLDQGSGRRMAGCLVQGRRKPQDVGLPEVRQHMGRPKARAAVGQGAGLVDHQDADLGQRFQGAAALDDDADAGGPREARDQGDGNRQDQRTRRSDDQDGEAPKRVGGGEPCAAGEQKREPRKTSP